MSTSQLKEASVNIKSAMNDSLLTLDELGSQLTQLRKQKSLDSESESVSLAKCSECDDEKECADNCERCGLSQRSKQLSPHHNWKDSNDISYELSAHQKLFFDSMVTPKPNRWKRVKSNKSSPKSSSNHKRKQKFDTDRSAIGDFPKIIKLNVGGHTFETSLQTLRNPAGKDVSKNMLSQMFSGRYSMEPDENGYYFIDRDGHHFRYILNYLRDGTNTHFPTDPPMLKEIQNELLFYGFPTISTSPKVTFAWVKGMNMKFTNDHFTAKAQELPTQYQYTTVHRKTAAFALGPPLANFKNPVSHMIWWDIRIDTCTYAGDHYSIPTTHVGIASMDVCNLQTWHDSQVPSRYMGFGSRGHRMDTECSKPWFQNGTLISVKVDCNQRKVYFYQNGELMGASNLSHFVEDIDRICPFVFLSHVNNQVTVVGEETPPIEPSVSSV